MSPESLPSEINPDLLPKVEVAILPAFEYLPAFTLTPCGVLAKPLKKGDRVATVFDVSSIPIAPP